MPRAADRILPDTARVGVSTMVGVGAYWEPPAGAASGAVAAAIATTLAASTSVRARPKKVSVLPPPVGMTTSSVWGSRAAMTACTAVRWVWDSYMASLKRLRTAASTAL